MRLCDRDREGREIEIEKEMERRERETEREKEKEGEVLRNASEKGFAVGGVDCGTATCEADRHCQKENISRRSR